MPENVSELTGVAVLCRATSVFSELLGSEISGQVLLNLFQFLRFGLLCIEI